MAQPDNIETIITSKAGLVTDLNASYISKEQYSHARNAVRNSKGGDLGTIGNEPSNTYCFSAPYKIIGIIPIPDGRLFVCSGDEVHSEIGLVSDCTYTKILNLDCLNFSQYFPITGEVKKDFNKDVVVYFTDKRNPIRRAELSKLSSVKDCDDLLLYKKITRPCLSLKKGQGGNIPNGVYSVALAYVVDGKIFSDWYSITPRIQLFSETNSNSIEIDIDHLDTEFKEYSIALVGNYIDPTTKGATKVARIVGTYSTKTKQVSLTDFINTTYPILQLSELVITKKPWVKAGIIASNSNHLFFADLVGREEENYQLKAMSIKIEYVVTQVEADYYENDGRDVGYYRDENYDFYIQGVYNTGEKTDRWHIPGRKATSNDRSLVASADVYEYDKQFSDCEKVKKIERWQVENTAGRMVSTNLPFTCGRRELGYGEMGYFQSTDLYPDNKDMFGEDANTPIRYHKMPDECKIARYTTIKGKTYINILGIRVKNVPAFGSKDIVGYEITRSDRKGGNGTVVARGLMTNIRSYTDNHTKEKVMFSNYPVNDLSPDQYLSSTQTSYKANKEHNFTPLAEFYNDRFSFYSPHTLFEPRYTLGTELKIEAEEVADVRGRFERVYKHPQQKLLNQFSFWLAAAVGFIEVTLVTLGRTTATEKQMTTIGVMAGVTFEFDKTYKIESVDDLISLDIIGYIKAQIKAAAFDNALSAIKTILQVIASLAVKLPFALLQGIRQADETLDIIYNLTGYTDYVYQYNSYAKFNSSTCSRQGNKRRRLLSPATYIPGDVVSIRDEVFNNYFRERTVFLELNKPILPPTNVDNSRNTMSGFGVCDSGDETISKGSAFYATSKVNNPNQYGALGSSQIVALHSCTIPLTDSPVLFGGDCIITRFQFQKRMQFFNQNMADTNYTPGTEYDYRLYRNIAYPRFWMDTSKYDFSNLITREVINYTKFSRTTTSKHNLDCKKKNDGKSISRIDDAKMYLSNNCVLDFFVECDYNINFRETTEHPFYSKKNTNLSQIFRNDRLAFEEEFKISRVYSDLYTTEVFSQQQRSDFNPASPIPTSQPNAVIYSLESFNLQSSDNWQYFLPANYFSFKESDFGNITGIHKLDQDRLIFLFSKASPYISMGRSVLQLSNQTVTIGDGGIFAQDPREVMPTDNNYGSCNSRWAFSNTHLGRFYPSETQGRIINFTESLDDISRQGISYWCKNYMPIFLYKYFPSYPKEENPLAGVGYLSVFDSFNETVYVTKRDFVPKKEYLDNIVYRNNAFWYKNIRISLRDASYFTDVSFTLSYSPTEKGFISWHDWHPDWVVQTENHFMTVKGDSVYKHNEAFDSYCNFYGIDYPFEYEAVETTGQNVNTIRSIEYLLEVYKYKNFGRDRFHVHHENFDRLIVHNTEQISPLLFPKLGNPNPEENLYYPKSNGIGYDITFFKEENKYRINQFWSAVKDRGEFTNNEIHLFPTDESGYKSIINPLAIDLNKPEEQRSKFRHYVNKFRFIKTVSGSNKFLCKILNIKTQNSPR